MSRTMALLALSFAACAGPAAPATTIATEPRAACVGPLAGEPLMSRPGARACTEACLEAHEAACAVEGKVWRIELSSMVGQGLSSIFGKIHVSSTGLVRMELPDRDHFSVDASMALTCSDACGPGTRVCFPTAYKVKLSVIDGVDDCTHELSPAEPWQGRSSHWAQLSCKGLSVDVRVVPSLRGVRDALLTSGLMPRDDPGADLDGLVVGVRYDGAEVDFLSDVVEEDCGAVALPAGHDLHASLADFEALDAMTRRLWTAPDRPGDGPDVARTDIEAAMDAHEAKLCAAYTSMSSPEPR